MQDYPTPGQWERADAWARAFCCARVAQGWARYALGEGLLVRFVGTRSSRFGFQMARSSAEAMMENFNSAFDALFAEQSVYAPGSRWSWS